MSGIPGDNDMIVYRDCMEEIRRRTDAANGIMCGTHTTPFRATNIEFVCLQVRKILELIALASMASHKEEFAKQHQKFAEMWRAKRILEDLEKLNPGFYPIPTKQVRDEKTGKVLAVQPIAKPYLTKADFETVYQECSGLLHAQNPYGIPRQLPQIEASIPEWLEKIKNLLNHHHVQLFNSTHQLWVVMRAESDDRVHVHLFQRIDDPQTLERLKNERQQKQ
jgi:hypothetical protein